MDQQRLRELARKGLELELRELEDLGRGGPVRKAGNGGVTVRKRATPKWSAAKRAEISTRMKAYWAQRRAGGSKPATGTAKRAKKTL